MLQKDKVRQTVNRLSGAGEKILVVSELTPHNSLGDQIRSMGNRIRGLAAMVEQDKEVTTGIVKSSHEILSHLESLIGKSPSVSIKEGLVDSYSMLLSANELLVSYSKKD